MGQIDGYSRSDGTPVRPHTRRNAKPSQTPPVTPPKPVGMTIQDRRVESVKAIYNEVFGDVSPPKDVMVKVANATKREDISPECLLALHGDIGVALACIGNKTPAEREVIVEEIVAYGEPKGYGPHVEHIECWNSLMNGEELPLSDMAKVYLGTSYPQERYQILSAGREDISFTNWVEQFEDDPEVLSALH